MKCTKAGDISQTLVFIQKEVRKQLNDKTAVSEYFS